MYLKKPSIKNDLNCKKLKPRVSTFFLRSIPLNNLTLFTNMSRSQPMCYINTSSPELLHSISALIFLRDLYIAN